MQNNNNNNNKKILKTVWIDVVHFWLSLRILLHKPRFLRRGNEKSAILRNSIIMFDATVRFETSIDLVESFQWAKLSFQERSVRGFFSKHLPQNEPLMNSYTVSYLDFLIHKFSNFSFMKIFIFTFLLFTNWQFLRMS